MFEICYFENGVYKERELDIVNELPLLKIFRYHVNEETGHVILGGAGEHSVAFPMGKYEGDYSREMIWNLKIDINYQFAHKFDFDPIKAGTEIHKIAFKYNKFVYKAILNRYDMELHPKYYLILGEI